MSKQEKCGVPWCIGLAERGKQYCCVHEDKKCRFTAPPHVQRELELRFTEAMRGTAARDADARH